jgi:HTH-type transcriptional regulator/antitoxin HigA
MRLLIRTTPREHIYQPRHAAAERRWSAWAAILEISTWRTPVDVKDTSSATDHPAGETVCFDVGANKWRIIANLAFKPEGSSGNVSSYVSGAPERLSLTGATACIPSYPFLICGKILSPGRSSAFDHRQESNADKKRISRDARGCCRTMFRSRETPPPGSCKLPLGINQMSPDGLWDGVQKVDWHSCGVRQNKVDNVTLLVAKETELAAARSEMDGWPEIRNAGHEATAEEEDRVAVLAVLIRRYEDEHWALPMPDPIFAVQCRMDEPGSRQSDMMEAFGNKTTASRITNRERPLLFRIIRRLSARSGLPIAVPAREYAVASGELDEPDK